MCEKCKLMHNKKYLYVCIVKAMQSILNKVDSFFLSLRLDVFRSICCCYDYQSLYVLFNSGSPFQWRIRFLMIIRCTKQTHSNKVNWNWIGIAWTEYFTRKTLRIVRQRWLMCEHHFSFFLFFTVFLCVCVSLISCAISILCPKIFARLISFHNVLMSLEMN